MRSLDVLFEMLVPSQMGGHLPSGLSQMLFPIKRQRYAATIATEASEHDVETFSDCVKGMGRDIRE
jgi:hypothetical protein